MADNLIINGTVLELIKGGNYIVEVTTASGVRKVLCKLSGKIRQNKIKVIVGDNVDIEISPYNLDIGRIIYRNKV